MSASSFGELYPSLPGCSLTLSVLCSSYVKCLLCSQLDFKSPKRRSIFIYLCSSIELSLVPDIWHTLNYIDGVDKCNIK